MITTADITRLLEQGENLALEFKDSQILSDPFKLARVMTAFADAEGGILLIGIRDGKTIEGMKGKKRHEEHIMDIATDRCDPSLSPRFERIHVPRKGDVYTIEVQERQGPYQSVRTPKGYRFFIRVGSTIREKKPSELVSGEQGVEISAESGLEKFWSWFGKKMLYRLYGKLNVNLLKLRIGLGILALLLIIVPILMIFRFGNVIIVISDYPVRTYTVMFVSLVTGLVLIDFLSYMPRTTCPMCDSQFSFRTRKKWVFEKRTIREGLEDWKTRTLKQCDECGHEELGKLVYEEVSV